MEYAKPHLNYNEQVALMKSRGMHVDDDARAVALLQRVGYYRLSAYTYVLRQPASDDEAQAGLRRSSRFVAGADLADVERLYDFDARLRSTMLDALQTLEVALRVRIGYTLGKRDKYGHLLPTALDPQRCTDETPPRGGVSHTDWLERYDDLCRKARNEDFVSHFHVKYDGRMPIWVATEIMTFGALTGLYYLLNSTDANRIATTFRAGNREVFHGWLNALNILRNHCAHNARIWNRKTIYPPARPPVALVPETLHHVRGTDNNRLYILAAITAHLMRQVDPATRWIAHFRDAMKRYPEVNGMTPQNTMGFPDGWQDQEIWSIKQARPIASGNCG